MAATPLDSTGRARVPDGASRGGSPPSRGRGGHRGARAAIAVCLCCVAACRALASYERAPAPLQDGGSGGAALDGSAAAAADGPGGAAGLGGADPLDAAAAPHEHGDALATPPADAGLRPPEPNPDCDAYCSTVQEQCSGENTVYAPGTGECAALCPHFLRTGGGQNDNTLECRINQADQVAMASEKSSYCDAASRMGETERVATCGSACESYCQLMSSVCAARFELDFASDVDCRLECEGLDDRGNFHAGTCEEGGDAEDGASVQCRMWHVGAAAIALASSNAAMHGVHCNHAAGAFPCVGERNTAAPCAPRARAPLEDAP